MNYSTRLCGLLMVIGNFPIDTFSAEPTTMSEITVTGTREAVSLAETPASVGTIKQQDIQLTAPTHPSQILSQIPGVAVAVTNGEGHTTAIRQPFTTSPLYLYLEDGIPTRATGFFNHNALYEVNIPAAGGIEVIRGPATALYGSDAIGGVVNVITKAPSIKPEASVAIEGGSFGWYRLLGDASTGIKEYGGVRGSINYSHTDGWRDATAYDRTSANLRWDYDSSDTTAYKTILGVTHIDQQTGANSPLTYNDYINNPTKNNFSIAYRKVEALRLSTNYDNALDANTLLSLTPYFRNNYMDLNGSFNLSSDPRIEKTDVKSYGVLAKWRRDYPQIMRARVILGIDIDYSPGSRSEDNLLLSTTGTGADRSYNSYTLGTRIYDYDVTYRSLSPYVHTEFSPTEKLRVTAGMRYDTLSYDFVNHLPAGVVTATVNGGTRYYYQVGDTSRDFSHASPKLGLTYAIAPNTHLYTSYNQGFRAPAESQLFRAGNDSNTVNAQLKAENALGLQPIKAQQFELGIRGDTSGWKYDLVTYLLTKQDDLVSQRDLVTNVTITSNAGKTEHKGIELSLNKEFTAQWQFNTALSYAKHTYVEWITNTADYSGKEISKAPRWITNTRLGYKPDHNTIIQLEWEKLGSYWLEDSNSSTFGKYPGHDLLHLRMNHALTSDITVFARIINQTDKRFADSAQVSSNTAVYSPGLPRTYYLGAEIKW